MNTPRFTNVPELRGACSGLPKLVPVYQTCAGLPTIAVLFVTATITPENVACQMPAGCCKLRLSDEAEYRGWGSRPCVFK